MGTITRLSSLGRLRRLQESMRGLRIEFEIAIVDSEQEALTMRAIKEIDEGMLISELTTTFRLAGIDRDALSDMQASLEPPVAGRRQVTVVKPEEAGGQTAVGYAIIAATIVLLIIAFAIYGFFYRVRIRRRDEKPPRDEDEDEENGGIGGVQVQV